MHIKGLENIQATMGTCMKNLENNQANIGTCMKNMETNQANLGASLKNMKTQMGQLAKSMREQPPKSFPSDTETNPKQCMGCCNLRNSLSHWTVRSCISLSQPAKQKTKKTAGEGLLRHLSDAQVRSLSSSSKD